MGIYCENVHKIGLAPFLRNIILIVQKSSFVYPIVMNGLFVGPPSEAYLLFSLLCSRNFEATLIQCDTPEEAVFALKDFSREFIIFQLPTQDSLDLLNYLEEEGSTIPILFTTDLDNIGLVHHYMDHPNFFSKVCYQSAELVVIKSLEKLLNTGQIESKKLSKNYYPIPVKLFHKIPSTHFDIYIKLTEKKFLKVFKKSDILTPGDIDHYLDKEIDDFFLTAEDFLQASGNFIKQVSDVLKEQELDSKTMKALAKFSHNAVCTMVKDLGIKPQIIQIANEGIQALEKMQIQEQNIKEHFNNIMKGQDYMSEHTLMLVFLSCAIANEANWGSQFSANKLTIAAFFHDIAAHDDLLPASLLMSDDDPRNIKALAPNILRQLLNHSHKSAEIVSQLPDVSPEVDQIIKLHHENYDGTGYPAGLPAKKIFPLAVIMIVAEEFINELYRNKMKSGTARLCIDAMDEKYKEGHFAKAVECLRKALAVPRRTS